MRSGSIYVVSDYKFSVPSDSAIKIVEVPTEFISLSAPEIIYKLKLRGETLVERHRSVPIEKMKVAFVGNWKMRCGIATYAESLWPEVAKHIGDFKLFIEKNDAPTGPVNVMGDGVAFSNDKVVSCWKRGESLQQLAREIKEYDPDVIWIQHEFGIWPNAGFWLALMSQLSEYRILVTMHSVFHHKDKTIVEAAIPEIVVHLDGAKEVLKVEKGVPGDVYVIPHGCAPVGDSERLWNFYKSDHTFMQFGFGFRYKGWELSIRAAHILKQRYDDVFFTGLFSESPFNVVDHQIYYDELMNLVEKLDLRDNVALIRGYQSDAALDSYMKTNQAIVFPYISHPAHEVFGASGAARLAMSRGAPVVTTSVNHFSDLPTLKADTPEDIADALDRMFSNPMARQQQVTSQVNYIEENTWEKVAKRYLDLFASRRAI